MFSIENYIIKLLSYEKMIKEHATKHIGKEYHRGVVGRKLIIIISHFLGFCDDCDICYLLKKIITGVISFLI